VSESESSLLRAVLLVTTGVWTMAGVGGFIPNEVNVALPLLRIPMHLPNLSLLGLPGWGVPFAASSEGSSKNFTCPSWGFQAGLGARLPTRQFTEKRGNVGENRLRGVGYRRSSTLPTILCGGIKSPSDMGEEHRNSDNSLIMFWAWVDCELPELAWVTLSLGPVESCLCDGFSTPPKGFESLWG